MYLGVDYYPEHWPSTMVEEDIQRIADLGATMVRMGEFAWHLMEPEEGVYDFSYYDGIIDKLAQRNIFVMLGTPTATFPAWLAKKHPEIFLENIHQVSMSYGGRRQYCYNSPVYAQYAATITEKMVQHYSKHPNVVAWQVDNEFGHEGSDMCYCSKCHRSFQEFLRMKYEDIQILNQRWGTIFWGQTYNNFEEVPIPLPTITTHNPSLKLDYYRFRSFSLNHFAKMLTDVVKANRGIHQLVTSNFAGGFFDKAFDHQAHAKEYDVVSYDNYPVWGGLEAPVSPAETALSCDFMRGLLGRNFWIPEQLMGAQGHDIIGFLPRPGQSAMWAFQAFAHGCDSLLFFRYRGMTRGAEQFCQGIIDPDNVPGSKYQETKELFKTATQWQELIESPVSSQVALLYDHDNIWSWKSQRQSSGFDFLTEALRLYKPFYAYNINIDVVPWNSDFSSYKVLLLPVMQIIEEDFAKRLKDFVAGGGTVIFSYRGGIKDKDNNLYLGMPSPGYIADLCGIQITGYETIPPGESIDINTDFYPWDGSCQVFRDLIHPVSAGVLATYGDSVFEDDAAITVNNYGQGKAYYVGGGIDQEILLPIANSILTEHGIYHFETPDQLEAYPRMLDNQLYYMVTNHGTMTIDFMNREIPPYGTAVIPI